MSSKLCFESGFGLDVSSGLELGMALDSRCPCTSFSAGRARPIRNSARQPCHAERRHCSDGQLRRTSSTGTCSGIPKQNGARGVRLTINFASAFGANSGFPAALSARSFWIRCPAIALMSRLHGLQFHTSWNLSPEAQIAFSIESLENRWKILPGSVQKARD